MRLNTNSGTDPATITRRSYPLWGAESGRVELLGLRGSYDSYGAIAPDGPISPLPYGMPGAHAPYFTVAASAQSYSQTHLVLFSVFNPFPMLEPGLLMTVFLCMAIWQFVW